VGDPCPTGAFAESLPTTGTVIYVDSSAAPGGDGSLSAPYASLSQISFVSLGADTTVALAKGIYAGTLSLKAGVRVIGACAAETILTGVDAPVPSVISVTTAGESAWVQNLTVRGAPQRGADVSGGRSLRLDGVVIDSCNGMAILVDEDGSRLLLEDVVVRDTTAPGGGATDLGVGIHAQRNGAIEATRLILDGNRTIGLSLTGASATLTDSAVRGTLRGPIPDARGVNVENGASLDANRFAVTDNARAGVYAHGADTTVTLTDGLVATVPNGVVAEEGAHLTASRMAVIETTET
jgi:hypothetical protein